MQNGEELDEFLLPVARQLERLANGVDDPPQHSESRLPRSVALAEFLHGDGLLARSVRAVVVLRIERAKDLVEDVEEGSSCILPLSRRALHDADKVVDAHFALAEPCPSATQGLRPGGVVLRGGRFVAAARW